MVKGRVDRLIQLGQILLLPEVSFEFFQKGAMSWRKSEGQGHGGQQPRSAGDPWKR